MTPSVAHSKLTPGQIAAVQSELQAILSSSNFSSSKRCKDLLEFVVTSALKEDFNSLTERFVGATVFGRPITYETATDAIVRVRANDVRHRLAEYYLMQSHPSAVRIVLTTGSYVPEFQFHETSPVQVHDDAATPTKNLVETTATAAISPRDSSQAGKWRVKGVLLWSAASLALGCLLCGAYFLYFQVFFERPIDRFWDPLLRHQNEILICAGGNTFLQAPVPGFFTASKEIDYPYFSLQTEIATTLLSTLIERKGSTPQFRFAASTPLPEFHEHPIILLNAYNNPWTLRLTESLPIRFSADGLNAQLIYFQQHPEKNWHRASSQSYENEDDYALLARFWDKTTDNWVLVLAGLGRNGTEAAARFVTDPRYMQELHDRLGRSFDNLNIEVVLKVSVVDGKTGAPEIVAIDVS